MNGLKTITIELTEQQEHFLKMFAANHYPGADDNLATCKPIHRTYTYSAGYANKGKCEHFWNLLFGVGKKLNEEATP